MIAQITNIGESTLSRKINGKGEFTAKEVLALANFFDITCDEFITGRKQEYRERVKSYGLSQKALDRLAFMNKKDPKLLELLDILLVNERLIDTLLRSFLLYIETPMLKLASIVPYPSVDEIALNTRIGREIITGLLSSNYKQLLDAVKYEWENRNLKKPVFRMKKKYLNKMRQSLPEETARRLKTKHLSNRIRPKPFKEYWKLIENLQHYRETELFFENNLVK